MCFTAQLTPKPKGEGRKIRMTVHISNNIYSYLDGVISMLLIVVGSHFSTNAFWIELNS
jgi:hypothetical protein